MTGKTAAELITERADSTQPHMGLTTWKSGSVQKADVTVAKNYLYEAEIQSLNRIVTMWLDYAEDQAMRRKEVFLKDWVEKLDAFLTFNERQVLEGTGKVSHQQATAHAQAQYEQFAAQRRALLEAEGAEFQMRALEDAAKALPQAAKDWALDVMACSLIRTADHARVQSGLPDLAAFQPLQSHRQRRGGLVANSQRREKRNVSGDAPPVTFARLGRVYEHLSNKLRPQGRCSVWVFCVEWFAPEAATQ